MSGRDPYVSHWEWLLIMIAFHACPYQVTNNWNTASLVAQYDRSYGNDLNANASAELLHQRPAWIWIVNLSAEGQAN